MLTPGGQVEIIKKTDKYVILKKRSGRFGVRSMNRSWINGADKEKILSEAGLIEKAKAKPKKEEAPAVDDDKSEEVTPA